VRRFLLLVPLVVLVAGCHEDNSDGIDHAAVESAQAPLKAAAVRSGGDWTKLTPDERKLFLDRARGNEQGAKTMLGMFTTMPSGPPKKP